MGKSGSGEILLGLNFAKTRFSSKADDIEHRESLDFEKHKRLDSWLGGTRRTTPRPTGNATMPKDENRKRRRATENERALAY